MTAFSRLPAPGRGVVLRTAKRWRGRDGRPAGKHVLGRRGADAAPCGLHRPAGSVHAGLPVAGRTLAGLRRSTQPVLRNPRVMRLPSIMLLPLPSWPERCRRKARHADAAPCCPARTRKPDASRDGARPGPMALTDPPPLRLHRAAFLIPRTSRTGDPEAAGAQSACVEVAWRIVTLEKTLLALMAGKERAAEHAWRVLSIHWS